MACRCEDIKIMEKDKELLSSAQEIAGKLADTDGLIDDSLRDIGGMLPDTMIIPDEGVVAKMYSLNDKTRSSIGSMNKKLSEAMEKLCDELSDAKWEDFFYHLSHPIETIQGWLG